MTGERLLRIRRALVFVLVALYVVAGIAGFFADFDDTSDTVLWVAFLCGGAALMLVGLLAAPSSGWLSASLVSIGAAAGGIALLWSIIVPVAAAAVVAMSFATARRASA